MDVSFASQIVKLKIFRGKKNKIKSHFVKSAITDIPFQSQKNKQKKVKSVSLTQRKGQARFRNDILKVYNYKCAISNVGEPVALEAAHIERYINEHSNHVNNGICLRSDIHKLFDNHLISIDANYKIHISSKIKNSE